LSITTIGIDPAKNIFQVHAITNDGTIVFNKLLHRARMLPFFAKLQPCLIGISCGVIFSSHAWA